jgi:hypothetical protein
MRRAATFDPRADAIPLSLPDDLESAWRARWRTTLDSHVPEALTRLRRSFGGAVDLHGLPGWMESPNLIPALVGAGWVFATLDYFGWPALPRADPKRLRAYVERRHLDCWQDNGSALLEWLGVQRRVPEEWLPHQLIERHLVARLGLLPTIDNVQVEAVVSLNPAGGSRWLRERSSAHWSDVTARLAAGECCPVVAFDAAGARAVLAVHNGREVRCYDPADPTRPAVLDSVALDGLLPLRYTPARPPLTASQRAADAMRLGAVLWRLERSWKLSRHVPD